MTQHNYDNRIAGRDGKVIDFPGNNLGPNSEMF